MAGFDILKILQESASIFIDMAVYLMIGIFFAGLLHIFFNKDMIVKYIGKRNIGSVIKAALFGVPLPLCSCGVIPSMVYLSKNGASKGAVVSFLISTPQTGIDSIIATYGMMGPIFAIYRPLAALVMGIVGGGIIHTVDVSDNNRKWKINDSAGTQQEDDLKGKSLNVKIKRMFRYAFVEFIDDISSQFLIGILISGLIAYFIPENFFTNTSINSGILGMFIMMAVGIPMYVCATASIPIAITLMMKGFSPAVAFVFLVTGPATNAASLAIITKILGKKITATYLAVIVVCSIGFGYLLDFIFSIVGTNDLMMVHNHNHDSGGIPYEIKLLAGILLFVLILMSFYRKFFSKWFLKKVKDIKMASSDATKIMVDGMTCNHCVMNVKKAIMQNSGVQNVEVDLINKTAVINGDFDLDLVKKSIEDVGYKVI